MRSAELSRLLAPYNPWAASGQKAFRDLPGFTRPVFDDLREDLGRLPQILSITGPRRVGKTTLLRQLIRHLLGAGEPADLLLYYSLDDPALFRPSTDPDRVMEDLMLEAQHRSAAAGGRRVHLFLDEVQRLDRWELYLKKYYDLGYPIRIVVSGSASSPILKKSCESLLGRVKDYHLLPFSFREFMLFRSQEQPTLLSEMNDIREDGLAVMGMLAGGPQHIDLSEVRIRSVSEALWQAAYFQFERYLVEGGFPEVWAIETWEKKVEYLYDNQVKKVIYEDLVLAAEFRKPELLKRFYISLLERPGREVNLKSIAAETGVALKQLEKYLPLLELTDLVAHIERFRKSSLRVRRGALKFYLVDLALRNAVLRLEAVHQNEVGLYAENLVFNALRKWKGPLAIDYYRERGDEIDFVVHLGPRKFLGVEVKYKNTMDTDDLAIPRAFARRFKDCPPVLVVTRRQEHFRMEEGHVFLLPLLHFLLMFD